MTQQLPLPRTSPFNPLSSHLHGSEVILQGLSLGGEMLSKYTYIWTQVRSLFSRLKSDEKVDFTLIWLVCINTACHFAFMRLLPCPRCPTSPAAGTLPWHGPCSCNPPLQSSSSVSANSAALWGQPKPTPAWGRGLQAMTVTQLPMTPLDALPTASVLLLLPPAEHRQIN